MNQTHFTLEQSGNMLRRAKPPFAGLAVSCHAHAVFSLTMVILELQCEGGQMTEVHFQSLQSFDARNYTTMK